MKDRVKVMEDADRDKYLFEVRKNWLKEKSQIEEKHSRYNLFKIQESWLKIMRSAKTKSLKREVEIVAQSHERDMDRKDAILQMLDRDLDEAEEQHQCGVRTHLLNIEGLMKIQQDRLEALEETFREEVKSMDSQWQEEKGKLMSEAQRQIRELQYVIQEVSAEERAKEQQDLSEHQSGFEVIRNRNIEEDHQMRSNLEERVEQMKDRCNAALLTYRASTESNTADYRSYLARDAQLSKHVERKLRQVERMQASIGAWRSKLQNNRMECELRNSNLRVEKEHLLQHFQSLKMKMNRFRDDERQRLTELSTNGEHCLSKLRGTLALGEGILRLAEQCRRFETDREKVAPFYQGTQLSGVDVDNLPQETLREYISEFQIQRAQEQNNQKLMLAKQKGDLLNQAGGDHSGAGGGEPSSDPTQDQQDYEQIRDEIKAAVSQEDGSGAART